MNLKVFTFAYRPELSGFDTEALDRFCLDKEVFEYQSHFFQREGQAHWTICVRYRVIGANAPSQPDTDWSERDLLLRRRLKEYRIQQAQQTGKPPYIIFTDRQMDAFIRHNVRQLADFGPIKGFGPKKTELFGADILGIVGAFAEEKASLPTQHEQQRSVKPKRPAKKQASPNPVAESPPVAPPEKKDEP